MKRSHVVALALAVALVAAGSLAASLSWAPVAAQDVAPSAASQLARTITVVGQGTVHETPDIAQATIGVEAIAASVAEASSQASNAMTAIMAALADKGVADKDIQTAEYSVYVDTSSGALGSSAAPAYHVINMVSVTVRDLATVGDVIDAAVEAGANRIYGVSFTIEDTTAVESSAREAAVADAHSRAQHLASLVSASVGDVISVSEVIGGGYQTYATALKVDGLGGGAGVSPGQLQFTSSVQVVYELVPGAAQEVRTKVTSAAFTPTEGAQTYSLDLVAEHAPAETDDGLYMVGWVYVMADGEADPVQSLEAVFHTPFAGWAEGDQVIGEGDYLIVDDVNFDGYRDCAVIEPGGATWQVSHWFVWDADLEQFTTSALTDQLALLPWNTYSLDPDTRQITVTNMLGATGEVQTVYEVGEDGTLALVSADEGAPTIENGPFSPPPTTTG